MVEVSISNHFEETKKMKVDYFLHPMIINQLPEIFIINYFHPFVKTTTFSFLFLYCTDGFFLKNHLKEI